jgi:hypothetical protein
MSIDEGYPAGADYDEDEQPQPCGESGCICYGVGEEHADHACGCDCPRCPECQQKEENCGC